MFTTGPSTSYKATYSFLDFHKLKRKSRWYNSWFGIGLLQGHTKCTLYYRKSESTPIEIPCEVFLSTCSSILEQREDLWLRNKVWVNAKPLYLINWGGQFHALCKWRYSKTKLSYEICPKAFHTGFRKWIILRACLLPCALRNVCMTALCRTPFIVLRLAKCILQFIEAMITACAT